MSSISLLSRFTRSRRKIAQTLEQIATHKNQGPSREETLKQIAQHEQHRHQQKGSGKFRRGWEVAAANWVKKEHVDRGDVKVGLHNTKGEFLLLKGLAPRYVLPNLDGFALKPYVDTSPPPKEAGKEASSS